MTWLVRTRLGSAGGLLVAVLLVQQPAFAEQHALPPPTKPVKPHKPTPSKPAKPESRDPRDGKVRLEPDGPPPLIEPQRNSSPPARSYGSSGSGTGGGSMTSFGASGPGNASPFRYYFGVGGHLAIADSNLASVMQDLGGGMDFTALGGARGFPLLLGVQTGFDSYGGVPRTFFVDGAARDFQLTRTSFWLHGMLRLEPEWTLRPHVDLLAGVWLLDVSYSTTSGPKYADTIDSAATFSYGIGTGVRYVLPNGLSLDLSFVYMRGGAVTVPYAEGSTVVDGSLYYEERHLETISQGLVMLQLGYGTP